MQAGKTKNKEHLKNRGLKYVAMAEYSWTLFQILQLQVKIYSQLCFRGLSGMHVHLDIMIQLLNVLGMDSKGMERTM